jgi:glucosamine--fructose-6-phosphate aminotransferase (isomerizing)
LGGAVALGGAAVIVISQSGASDDLVRSAQGARRSGAKVIAIVNVEKSPVGASADASIAIGAGPELAVPATKSVIGSIAAGMALLGQMVPAYAPHAAQSAASIMTIVGKPHPQSEALMSALLRSHHVYVIGRDTGFGAAQELALKLKECCAIHAEAHSSSEVLHGPLQLVTNPLLVIILDTELAAVQPSLANSEQRFRHAGAKVFRLRASDVGAMPLSPAAAAAALLCLCYPIVLKTARALGLNPDHPDTLSKVTTTL